MKFCKHWVPLFILLFIGVEITAQNTDIKGFANVDLRLTQAEKKSSFFLGEQDLFITSQITDKIGFLGETVFKYSPGSATTFNVSMERLIINYRFSGNHRILIGKHHTPFSLWNDKYHHGRVFFPTVDRPLLFRQGLIEIHTTGVVFQGLNLGNNNFGYQVMVGNGIGSNDFTDDNRFKSVTLEAHLKPHKGMKMGLTGYLDKFSSDAKNHHSDITVHDSVKVFNITQIAGGAYFTYFTRDFEILTEAHLITNHNDSVGLTKNTSFYAYFGYRLIDKIVPYFKVDALAVDKKELFYHITVKRLFSLGVRYEFSYLAIAKLEFNRTIGPTGNKSNGIYFQMATGF